MSEERLKDLLARAVPEALEIRADGVPERAAAVRRRQVLAGGAALAVVASVIVGGLMLRGSGDDRSRVANEASTAGPGLPVLYGAPLCPERLPHVNDANQVLPDLSDIVAIRMCPDLSPYWQEERRIPGDEAHLAGLDALAVGVGIDKFEVAIDALPDGLPDMCALANVANDRSSLMVVDDEGETTLVWTPLCGTVQTGGRQVHGADVDQAFLAALDRQRDVLDYTRPYDGIPNCETRVLGGPGKPGREELVTAIFCPPDGPGVPLDSDQLEALRTAWANPSAITEELNEVGGGDCVEGGGSTWLLAGTDHGDVVRMFPSRCNYLAWDGWSENLALPITLEELGLR